MATIRDILVDELAALSITLTENREFRVLTNEGIYDAVDDYTVADEPKLNRMLLTVLTGILNKPDVTEGDMSIKYDRGAIRAECQRLRDSLGIVAPTVNAPVIRDASDRW